MVMLSVTLLGLTFSMGKSLRILFPLLTTVMYGAYEFDFLLFCILFRRINRCSYLSGLQVPHVNRTDYQLIDISEDGFVSFPDLLVRLFISEFVF